MTDQQPTNQFPPPTPDSYPPADPAPVRRSKRGPIVAVAAAVAVLGAGIGIAVAVGTDDDDTIALGAPSSTTAGSPGAGSSAAANGKNGKKNGKKAGKKGKNTVIRGTILTESGSTWTVKTMQGKTTTIAIGTDTRFGTKKAPAKAADFPVGHQVAIAVTPASGSGGAITARRVRTPVAKSQGPSGTPAMPTPSPSSS